MVRNKFFDTYPVFFHAAGISAASPLWSSILSYEQTLPARNSLPSDRYTFVTWQGGIGPYWDEKQFPLFDSLKRLCVIPRVLGKDRICWNNTMKIDTVLEALETISTPYVIGADLTDVAVIDDPAHAIRVLENLGADILYCAEDYFWPSELISLRRRELEIPGALDTPYSHLNAGIFVGKTEACKKFFREAHSLIRCDKQPITGPDRRHNEQPIIKEVYVRNYPHVQIDFRCEVFQLTTRQGRSELCVPF